MIPSSSDTSVLTAGIGDFVVGSSPQMLRTVALGSCVGIAVYDPVLRIGGLAHILLPNSKSPGSAGNPAKFADTAIPLMVQMLEKNGAVRRRLEAKIAGGASMFTCAVQEPTMMIGTRNVEATCETLKALNIPIVAQDTAGTKGRTMELMLDSGNVIIRVALKDAKTL